MRGRNGKLHSDALFSGFMTCGVCGHVFSVVTSSRSWASTSAVQTAQRQAQLALVRPHLRTQSPAPAKGRSRRIKEAEMVSDAMITIMKHALTVRDERIAVLETRVRTLEEMIAKQEVSS
jgi:hypothetical protein